MHSGLADLGSEDHNLDNYVADEWNADGPSDSSVNPSNSANGVQNGDQHIQGRTKRGLIQRTLAWVDAKIYVYNVTFGLYMLDWWERVLFNALALLLLWFVCYNASEFIISHANSPAQAFNSWKPLWSEGGTFEITSVEHR